MKKRMTIRLVEALGNSLIEISKQRGISINALITEMAWQFVKDYSNSEKPA